MKSFRMIKCYCGLIAELKFQRKTRILILTCPGYNVPNKTKCEYIFNLTQEGAIMDLQKQKGKFILL